MTRFALLLLAAAMAAAVASTPRRAAHATVLEELSLFELSTRADAIVLARVRRSGARTTNVRGRLASVTVTVLGVREWLKGSGPAEVSVIEPGGTHGGGRTIIEGAPGYTPGETVVAFLVRRSDGFTTLGMAQGKYRVLEADEPNRARVVRDLRGVSLAGRKATLYEGELSRPEPLERFLTRIREAIRGRR